MRLSFYTKHQVFSMCPELLEILPVACRTVASKRNTSLCFGSFRLPISMYDLSRFECFLLLVVQLTRYKRLTNAWGHGDSSKPARSDDTWALLTSTDSGLVNGASGARVGGRSQCPSVVRVSR